MKNIVIESNTNVFANKEEFVPGLLTRWEW